MKVFLISVIVMACLLGCSTRKPVDPVAQAKFKADYARINQELKDHREANRLCLVAGKPPDECCLSSGGSPYLVNSQPGLPMEQADRGRKRR